MAMRTIKVNPLKISSINKAIKDLEDYKKKLKEFPRKYTEALTEFFVETLKVEAPQMTQHWVWDLRETDSGVKGVITFDEMVQFVEFGTGLVGSQNHEGINTEWLEKLPPPYNQGYESRAGQTGHYTDKQGRDYWVYEKNGRFYSTYGQKANPFIYRSVEELLEARKAIAENILFGVRG